MRSPKTGSSAVLLSLPPLRWNLDANDARGEKLAVN